MQTAILAVSLACCLLCLVSVVLLVLILRAVLPLTRRTEGRESQSPPVVPAATANLPVVLTLANPAAYPPANGNGNGNGLNGVNGSSGNGHAPAGGGPVVPPTWVEEREGAYKERQREGIRVE